VTAVTLGFEVHQPFRVREDFFWNNRMFKKLDGNFDELFEHYFSPRNEEIFKKVSEKCYYPTNRILLENIDRYKAESRKFKCAFSLSGVILEQCERFDSDLLETFKQLRETDCVEFLDQTYLHSLFSLYDDPALFVDDVLRHNSTMKELLGYNPRIFENTEFIYNNRIASIVENLGYRCIFTEGLEHIISGKSPNFVYKAKGGDLKVLLRNYKLTDDVGFRFSSRHWEEYPLTAEKYGSWLASTPGDCINIFMDYETFGEHHWKETGIFEFMRFLPDEVLKWQHLDFATPSEVIEKYVPVGEVDAYELGGTVSWADLERDTSCWLGNSMQWAAYSYHKQLRSKIQGVDMLKIWGYLSSSDHLYYMFTAGGGPGEVHSYFSPFDNPTNAFLNYLAVLFDLGSRIAGGTVKAADPFVFSNKLGAILGVAFGKRDFIEVAKKIKSSSLKFHMQRGDFEKWAMNSLKDEKLSKAIGKINHLKLSDEELRKKVTGVFSKSIK
jgi:alpha-amylase